MCKCQDTGCWWVAAAPCHPLPPNWSHWSLPGSGTTATGYCCSCPNTGHPHHPGLVCSLADPPPRTVLLTIHWSEAERRLARPSSTHMITAWLSTQPSPAPGWHWAHGGAARHSSWPPRCRITLPGLAAPSTGHGTNIATCPASDKPMNVPHLRYSM